MLEIKWRLDEIQAPILYSRSFVDSETKGDCKLCLGKWYEWLAIAFTLFCAKRLAHPQLLSIDYWPTLLHFAGSPALSFLNLHSSLQQQPIVERKES